MSKPVIHSKKIIKSIIIISQHREMMYKLVHSDSNNVVVHILVLVYNKYNTQAVQVCVINTCTTDYMVQGSNNIGYGNMGEEHLAVYIVVI